MAGEKFTVTLSANVKKFINSIKKATQSLKGMGMKNRGIVKNIQKMSSASKITGKSLQGMGQKGKTGFDNIDKSAKRATKKMSRFFKLAATGIAIMASLSGTFLLFKKALATAELGAAFQVQARAFSNLVANQGVNAEKLVSQLKTVSRGTLDTMSLITTASRALLLGIPASRLVDLMNVARKASKAMGTTVAGAFSDISLGIGRQSRLILDNLGIIIRVGVAYDNYARKIGTTAGALTDFEKRQAFLNEALDQANIKFKQSSKDIKDFKDTLDSFRAFAKDAFARISLAILVPFLALSQTLADLGFDKILKDFFDIKVPKALAESLESFIRFSKAMIRFTQIVVPNIDAIKFLFDFGGFPTKAANAVNKVLGVTVDTVVKLDEASRKLNKDKPFGDSFNAIFTKKIEVLNKQFGGFVDSLFGAGGDRPSIIEIANRRVLSLNNALDDTTSKASQIQQEFSKGIPLIEAGVESLTEKINKLQPTLKFSPVGDVLIESLIAQKKRLLVELNKLKKAQSEVVGPESFLEGVGLQSDTRFIRSAEITVSKMERIVKNINNLTFTDPKQIQKASKRLFEPLLDSIDSLPEELQKRVRKVNKALSKASIPNNRFKKGLNKWVDDFNSASGNIERFGRELAEGLAEGFDNFFFDTITGKITNLQEAFKSMFTSILRSVTRFLGEKATQEFLGIAFGATGNKTQSNLGLNASSLGGIVGKAGGFIKGLFSGGSSPTSVFSGGGGASSLGGVGGILSAMGTLPGLLGFADGGIANLVGASGSAMLARSPQLAAIAEKPGKKEAVMPLEKFTDLVQPVTINISAIDTKSFQQYMMDNKEIVLGALSNNKGSPAVNNLSQSLRGPF